MRRFAFVGFAIVALVLAACGGNDDTPEPTLGGITPVGTKESTPTPPPADGGTGAPAPVEPQLDEELTEVARGDLSVTIEPGAVYDLAPEALAAGASAAPSCDNLQFDFSWQVTDPYPADGVTLAWQIERSGAPVTVATGPAGNQAVGCGVLSAANQGGAAITVAIKYLIGALQ